MRGGGGVVTTRHDLINQHPLRPAPRYIYHRESISWWPLPQSFLPPFVRGTRLRDWFCHPPPRIQHNPPLLSHGIASSQSFVQHFAGKQSFLNSHTYRVWSYQKEFLFQAPFIIQFEMRTSFLFCEANMNGNEFRVSVDKLPHHNKHVDIRTTDFG